MQSCTANMRHGVTQKKKYKKNKTYRKPVFLICHLTAPLPILGHYQEDSLTHLMLITALFSFELKVTGSLIMRLA